MPDTHSYAVRRVNPFLGMVQVIATERGRALSIDGLVWQLQVLAERPEHTWRSDNQGPARKAYFRFGSWSEATGLRRVPINPIMDIQDMIAAGEALQAAVLESWEQVPFARTDHYERWLLDQSDQPLALLATATTEPRLADIDTSDWLAAADDAPFDEREALEALIGAHSGGRIIWLHAPPGQDSELFDHAGQRLHTSVAAPPLLPVQPQWPDQAQQSLIDRYLAWLAPWVLCLPDLDVKQRERFERAARKRPLEIAVQHRLYPQVLDRDLIEAARVEARLRQARSTTR